MDSKKLIKKLTIVVVVLVAAFVGYKSFVPQDQPVIMAEQIVEEGSQLVPEMVPEEEEVLPAEDNAKALDEMRDEGVSEEDTSDASEASDVSEIPEVGMSE